MNDPIIGGMLQQNPQAKQIVAALQSHIAEHLGFKYRKEMEDKLGVALPPPNEQLPEEIEVQLSRLLSDAGKQLSAQHMKEQAQMQAQAQAQDPVFQLQQAELQVKQAEAQRKAAKDLSLIHISEPTRPY